MILAKDTLLYFCQIHGNFINGNLFERIGEKMAHGQYWKHFSQRARTACGNVICLVERYYLLQKPSGADHIRQIAFCHVFARALCAVLNVSGNKGTFSVQTGYVSVFVPPSTSLPQHHSWLLYTDPDDTRAFVIDPAPVQYFEGAVLMPVPNSHQYYSYQCDQGRDAEGFLAQALNHPSFEPALNAFVLDLSRILLECKGK